MRPVPHQGHNPLRWHVCTDAFLRSIATLSPPPFPCLAADSISTLLRPALYITLDLLFPSLLAATAVATDLYPLKERDEKLAKIVERAINAAEVKCALSALF
eukprot:6188456-Pleurochrysis_carterae.AAC.3